MAHTWTKVGTGHNVCNDCKVERRRERSNSSIMGRRSEFVYRVSPQEPWTNGKPICGTEQQGDIFGGYRDETPSDPRCVGTSHSVKPIHANSMGSMAVSILAPGRQTVNQGDVASSDDPSNERSSDYASVLASARSVFGDSVEIVVDKPVDFAGHYLRLIMDDENDYSIEIKGLISSSTLHYHCTEQKARLTFDRICDKLPARASARLLCNGEELRVVAR